MSETAPLTPKEFASVVFDDRRSARWVRNECRRFIKTRGRRGIAVLGNARPYLIPRSEVARWGIPLCVSRAAKVS
jgi:hypothetical protein